MSIIYCLLTYLLTVYYLITVTILFTNRSGVIWQVARRRGHWKTLNNTVIALLEEAYLKNQKDLRHKDLCVC